MSEIRSVKPVVRVSEMRDENDDLTHKACCLCFNFIALCDLYVCSHGQKWDNCKPCAPFLGVCACPTQEDE